MPGCGAASSRVNRGRRCVHASGEHASAPCSPVRIRCKKLGRIRLRGHALTKPIGFSSREHHGRLGVCVSISWSIKRGTRNPTAIFPIAGLGTHVCSSKQGCAGTREDSECERLIEDDSHGIRHGFRDASYIRSKDGIRCVLGPILIKGQLCALDDSLIMASAPVVPPNSAPDVLA